MLSLAVLVSGGGSNLQAIIDQIEQNQLPNVKIEVVISNKPGVFALERAKKHGIPAEVLLKKDYPDKESFGEALLAQLDSYKPDLIVLAGCLLIIPEQVIRSYRNRIINIHPSLIPSFCGDGYYGLKVHEAVLARGVKVTGATVHFVDEGCDTGPIILQKAVPVKKGDTPELLQLRIMKEAEWLILPEAIRLISENKIEIKNNLVEIKE
jgi:phosphoribosylglycinamide formyltransferase-1